MTTLIATLLLSLQLTATNLPQFNTYTRCMEVVELDRENDIVTCVDAVGYEWQFYGCEDWIEHDLVCATMNDMGTQDTILDDTIEETLFSGYKIQ